MTRKTLRNIIWLAAGALAVAAIMYNPSHLATASILFILGTFQDEDDDEDCDYYDNNLKGF